jgi:hypothetical protein
MIHLCRTSNNHVLTPLINVNILKHLSKIVEVHNVLHRKPPLDVELGHPKLIVNGFLTVHFLFLAISKIFGAMSFGHIPSSQDDSPKEAFSPFLIVTLVAAAKRS